MARGHAAVITSTANLKSRFLRSLRDRSGRQDAGCILVEGPRLVADALRSRAQFEVVLYDPTSLGTNPLGVELMRALPLEVSFAATERVVSAACDTTTPQGIVAAVRPPNTQAVGDGVVLVIDGLRDPGNVGSMVRSAAAAGAGAVVTTEGTADVFGPKAMRAGMGAQFRIAVHADWGWPGIADLLPERIYLLAEPRGGTRYDLVDWTRSYALIVGAEQRGVPLQRIEQRRPHQGQEDQGKGQPGGGAG